MEDIELYVGTKGYTVYSAPVGLLLLDNGSIICKTEYYKDDSVTPECYIVSSGEYYCGGDKPCKTLLIS